MFRKSLTSIIVSIGIATVPAVAVTPVTPQGTLSETTLLASANFMNTEMLSPAFDNNSGEEELQLITDLLKEADRHLGTRYLRGGKGPKGFDCSGFTSYVYRQFGYNLSPSSRGQYTQGAEVATDEVMPGDLLFFKGRSSRSVGHVGIAIESNTETGEITFIHAAIKGGIRVDRTSMPYYKQRFIGARRVINNL